MEILLLFLSILAGKEEVTYIEPAFRHPSGFQSFTIASIVSSMAAYNSILRNVSKKKK